MKFIFRVLILLVIGFVASTAAIMTVHILLPTIRELMPLADKILLTVFGLEAMIAFELTMLPRAYRLLDKTIEDYEERK